MSSKALSDLFTPVIEALECELWGVELLPQGRRKMLRVYIDKPDGVGISDCEKVSRQISAVLDVEDPIAGEYTLEVSSPGMDRPLFEAAHFHKYVGEMIKLRLRTPYEGRRKFQGLLVGLEADDVVLRVEEEEFLFPLDAIDKANVVPRFEGN